MGRRTALLAAPFLLVTAIAHADDELTCPDGSALAAFDEPPAPDQRWCERPDGRRHGPQLISGPLTGGSRLTLHFADGLLDGAWQDVDATGRTVVLGEFHAGHRSGQWSQWTKDGTLLGTSTLQDGTGAWTRFHPNGKKAETGAYKDGLRDGPWTFWNDTGVKSQEGAYRAGKKHGAWTAWSVRGVLFREEEWDDGKLTGTRRGYHGEKGGKLFECAYKDDHLDGLCREWYPSGARRSETRFTAGQPDGEFTTWSPSGKLLEKGRYAGGQLVKPGPAARR